jgi:4'-phosphopantetheinyl transferase EntD
MGAAWVPFPLAISVAHCDGVAVSAVADPGTRIGVDIDRASAIPPEQRRYFVAPSEESTTSADTTLLWVLKEAAWKALGLSASLPFTSLQLVFDSALETVEALRVDGARVPARTHVIRLMQPHELLVAVVEVVK